MRWQPNRRVPFPGVRIVARLVHQTDKAYLIAHATAGEFWIPKLGSAMVAPDEFYISRAKAAEKGLLSCPNDIHACCASISAPPATAKKGTP